jgi:serine/threonine protein kinase
VPDTVSKEAKRLIYRMLEVDAKRRITARELVKESWVRCSDLPLTVFENAATYLAGSTS